MSDKEIYVKVTHEGPYLVYGNPPLTVQTIVADDNGVCINYSDDKTFEIKSVPLALCRCGKSKDAPFCDGSHEHSVDLTETAEFKPIEEDAVIYKGPHLTLKDNEKYCAFARFCDADGSIWNLIYDKDEEAAKDAIREAKLCPSGRLMIFDNEGNSLEEKLEKTISIIEDGGLKLSGPLWLKGGIRVESADGKSYEIRNRQTLCRCGHSKNKPFCDCAHKKVQFKANYKE